MPGARICQDCLALSGAAVAGGALGGTSGALSGIPVTLPDFLMIGAPKAGTTARPVSPRTGGRIAEVTWTRTSPAWMFDEATLHRATVALDNPDYVDVVLHSCRHRLGFEPDHRRTRRLSRGLAALPAIAVPAVTLGGMADANFPATDHQPLQPPPHSRRSS
jgi:hypothetical protein